MILDQTKINILRIWAKTFALRKPYKLEIWVTGAGQVIADVYWTDSPKLQVAASSQIGWEGNCWP